MTAVQTSLLVLLDLCDKYVQFEQTYNPQLFVRFTNKYRCVLHILSSRSKVRLRHFFIPNAENKLIGARVFLFQNTIFYIYCINEATVRLMEKTYNYPMFVKAFHAESLSTYLHQAAIAHLVEQAEHKRNKPEEYDISLQTAVNHANRLAEELKNHMIVKTGVQSDDRR